MLRCSCPNHEQSFSTILSKGIIDETSATFNGLYNGSMSLPGIKDKVEKNSDLVINVGPHLSSSNTGSFTREIKEENLIVLHPHYCSVQGEKYDGLHFIPVLEKIVAEFEKNASTYKKGLELESYRVCVKQEKLGRLVGLTTMIDAHFR